MKTEIKEEMKPKRVIRGIKFFNVRDIAETLDLSIVSARLYLKSGKIPGALKINTRWYISNRNLDKWLSQDVITLEQKILRSIRLNIKGIKDSQRRLRANSAPVEAVKKMQGRLDKIEKNLADYLKDPIKKDL
jgi:hypothetical protein